MTDEEAAEAWVANRDKENEYTIFWRGEIAASFLAGVEHGRQSIQSQVDELQAALDELQKIDFAENG